MVCLDIFELILLNKIVVWFFDLIKIFFNVNIILESFLFDVILFKFFNGFFLFGLIKNFINLILLIFGFFNFLNEILRFVFFICKFWIFDIMWFFNFLVIIWCCFDNVCLIFIIWLYNVFIFFCNCDVFCL